MNNLAAEMARYGVSDANLQSVIGCTANTVRNKRTGVTEFTIGEAFKIRDTFFPGMRLEYLFQIAPDVTGTVVNTAQSGTAVYPGA